MTMALVGGICVKRGWTMRIEAIFGGIAGLFVLFLVVYSLATTQFGSGSSTPARTSSGASVSTISARSVGTDGVCECYNEAFKLAGSNVGVMSAEYRTGFEQCRALRGVEGGDAWTAGWNARLSSRPYEASCKSYRKRSA